MTRALRRLDGASIVLHGAFAPRSFHPAWFASQGLLADDEAKAAIPGDGGGVLVVSGELTAWRAGWIAVQVTHERLTVTPHGLVVQTSERHAADDVAQAVDVLATRWSPALHDADVAVQRLFDAFYDVGA